MRNTLLFGCLSLLFISCHDTSTVNTLESPKEVPIDYMFMQRAYPTGKINSKATVEAIAAKRSMTSRNQFKQSEIWEFAGPANVGGRITDIEIPIDQSEVYYVGTASGGIFKTTDGGTNWSPIFDDLESLSIGDIEISKSNTNIIWVGTGEVNAGGGSLAYDGSGIYESTDAGLTWTGKGLANVGSISKVIIDPNNSNTIFAAAMGPLFENDGNRGIYKSTDNGSTWEHVLFVSDSTGIIDMVNHPTNSNILYAAAWERVRRPQYRTYGGHTSGIYKSIDGGDSWDKLTNDLPSLPEHKGRISIAISQSNPDVLYARYADTNGSIEGVYRTSNGGENWTEVNSSQLTNIGFHWWFRGVYVDPLDENVVYNVDFVVEKSTDGGNSWSSAFPNVHVDQHALAFNAQNNNEVLLGNDGGVYRSNNNGATSTKFLNLPITQFYRFYVDPQNPGKIYGGAQDNNTLRTTSGGINDWRPINGGDGFQPLVDPTNTNTIYALSQRGNLVKSTNDGASFSTATNGISGADRNNWDTPITFDPQNSSVLYYGTERLWKTTNAAASWSPVSPDLTSGSGGGNLSFGTITTIDVSPVDSDVIVVGTDDSNVSITRNGGSSWSNISANLPNLWTTKVLMDRTDANTIYVTFSGYRYARTNTTHVFKSTDAGASWLDIGGGLPDIPVNDIVKDTYGDLYIATDVGVFTSEDEGANWSSFGSNMPAVVVNDLHIDENEGLLYAATYGRSAYKIDISEEDEGGEEEVLSVPSGSSAEGLKVYPNPASEMITVSFSEQFAPSNVTFFDRQGKVVYEHSISRNNASISISHLKSGIYFVKISNDNNAFVRKLLVK